MKNAPAFGSVTWRVLWMALVACILFSLIHLFNRDADAVVSPALAHPIADPSTELAGTTSLVQPAVNFFPADGSASAVPFDVATGSTASQSDLAVFAWQEFISLNYASNYPTRRGTPDTTGNDEGLTKFLNLDPQTPRVWQTFKHRVEIYPFDESKFSKNFDDPPRYNYAAPIMPITDPTNGTPLSQLNSYFNNLDETTEINLCTMFVEGNPNAKGAQSVAPVASGLPGAPRRVIYQAKANRYMWQYVNNGNLWKVTVRGTPSADASPATGVIATTSKAVTTAGGGGLPVSPDLPYSYSTIAFPGGKIGGANEGTIELKVSWRQLTWTAYQSGRFLTGPIIRYVYKDNQTQYQIIDSPSSPYTTQPDQVPYGLAGVHIIHKTASFPTFVFATFEQIDNLTADPLLNNQLFYYNRNAGIAPSDRQNVNSRAHAISSDTEAINEIAQQQVKTKLGSSIWQYYKLVGVQGAAPVSQENNDYFLANIVTETNEVLRSFSGTLNQQRGTIDPTKNNVFSGSNQFLAGGCKGCHGNAQIGGADFSFITLQAPFDVTDLWRERLNCTEHTGARFGNRSLTPDRIHVRPAHSRYLDEVAGPGWLAVGDSAVSYDPLSSVGIEKALSHACALTDLTPSAVATYRARIGDDVEHYLRERRRYYAAELRWSDQPFWRRRVVGATA